MSTCQTLGSLLVKSEVLFVYAQVDQEVARVRISEHTQACYLIQLQISIYFPHFLIADIVSVLLIALVVVPRPLHGQVGHVPCSCGPNSQLHRT